MSEILRTRTISPLTRLETSVSYKIYTKAVGKNDTLRVEINHEVKPGKWVYTFKGADIVDKKSIHFTVKEVEDSINISWGKLSYQQNNSSKNIPHKIVIKVTDVEPKKPVVTTSGFKKFFPPVVDEKTRVLILGSLPGDESLRLQQYYANPRNHFWKIMSTVFGEPIPALYSDKLNWLLNHNIGLWDVCHSANRKGSLDQHITDEIPNDIPGLLKKHPSIATIVFNGLKAEKTFHNHFVTENGFLYQSLISSSAAAAKSLVEKASMWSRILVNEKEAGDE